MTHLPLNPKVKWPLFSKPQIIVHNLRTGTQGRESKRGLDYPISFVSWESVPRWDLITIESRYDTVRGLSYRDNDLPVSWWSFYHDLSYRVRSLVINYRYRTLNQGWTYPRLFIHYSILRCRFFRFLCWSARKAETEKSLKYAHW
jgi:hypothetical protein